MQNLTNILKSDFDKLLNMSCIHWDDLRNKTILITGANGLIGSNLVNTILYANSQKDYNIKIVAVVRNIEKALNKFIGKDNISFITSNVQALKNVNEEIDFIVHAANPTSSRFFIEQPVETIQTAIIGTQNLLEIAKAKKVKNFVFLSSMEVYGNPKKGEIVSEKHIAGFDPTVTRNCYPMSKKLCESLCQAYYSEYNVPTNVLRLTQTFGPGVEYNDGRIFAEFMRCVVEKHDIVLKSKGETERCYLYTADAVSAILTTMLSNKGGECYTVANPETYCSIAEMAELVADKIGNNKIKVAYDIAEDITKLGYANTLYMNLNVDKLKSLGWKPLTGLEEMFRRMIMATNKDINLNNKPNNVYVGERK